MNYPEETLEGEPNGFSATIWSVLVDRCRSLLHEENGDAPINPQMITNILIKETNEFLLNFVNFFEECCSSISDTENYSENIIEVDGLLVNCLPDYLRTDNHTCHYEISSQVSKAHLETLFGPLDYEVVEEDDYFDPEIDIECGTQIGTNKNFKCAKCDFETDMKHCLKQHLMAHNDCTECGETFLGKNGKRDLLRHMKKHQIIIKPKNICQFCNKDYKKSWRLKRHIENSCKLKPKSSLDVIAIKPKAIKQKKQFILPKPNLDTMKNEDKPNVGITESEPKPNLELIDVKPRPNLDVIPIKTEANQGASDIIQIMQ